MKGIKKTLCLLLSLVMILSMGVPTFAFDNAASEAQANTTSSETSPFSIELSTDKSSYSATGIAKITTKVTNTSGKDIKNVSAEAVFTDLAPVKNGQTTAEAETLKNGESLEFTYRATINKNAKKLNIIEKIILFFVRLFNGGYSAKDNGFDNGREFVESSSNIKFGKHTAVNGVKVWFGESEETPDNPPTQDKSYEELIKDVDIDEIPYGDYNVVSDEETGRKYVNNIIVIDFDLDCTDKRKAEIINSINGTVIGGIGDDCLVIEIAPCSYMDLEKICDELNSNNSDIWTYFEEPYGLSVSGVPNDPWLDSDGLGLVDWNNNANLMYNNWWATAIELRNAWGYDEYFNDINIGVADVGFSNSHEDLKINIVSKENSPDNHGTHVAGIIGATHNNGKGIAGVVNKANMYGYDLQNTNGKFNDTLFKTADHKALKCLVEDYKCKIINFSVGNKTYINNNLYYTDENFTNEVTDKKIYDWGHTASKWICKLLEKGFDFIVVQSAGNGAENTNLGIDKKYNGTFSSISENNCYSSKNISIDKILSRVITVSAATISDNNNTYQLTDFSNGNARIAAPGSSIFSTVAGIPDSYVSQGQQYASMSGTSMSSPIVAGIAALVWSINKNFSGAIVRDIVCNAFYLDEWVYDNPKSTEISGNNRMVNAKLAVEEAIKKTYWAGTVTGKVVDIIPDEPKPLSNINITATEKNTNKTVYGKTNADGTFSLVLPAGNYNIIFSKGASELEIENVSIKYNSYLDLGTIEMMIPITKIKGIVKDNKTKQPIREAKIYVSDNYLPQNERGINNTSTDESGSFYIELSSSDDCSFYFDCDKYKTYILNNVDCSDTYIDLGDIFLALEDDRAVTASGNCGANAKWVLYEDGELVISGSGKIDFYSFKYEENVKNVIIKSGITSIGDFTFINFNNLTNITLPDSITSIGNYAFQKCTSLTSIIIPNSVTSIGRSTFSGCNSLTSVTIGSSVTNIGGYAFQNCSSLTSITIGNSVTSIDSGTFTGCNSLTSITIPNSVTSIGESAFEDCSSLTSITIPDSVTSISNYAFKTCRGLTSVTVGNSVTHIGYYAFGYCPSLTSVTIGNSVTNICDFAFRDCTSLTTLTIGNSVTSIGECAFEDCSSLTSITIPDSVTSIGECAFSGGSSLTSVTIGSSVTSIGEDVFAHCTSLTGIIIPNSVTSIDSGAFAGCTSLTDITLPDSVTNIGSCAFQSCSNLTSVIIPNSVTSIGDYAFSFCSSLISVIIPNSVTSIDNYTFADCSSLTSVTIPNSVTSIGDYAFEDCTSLISVTIPKSVTSIGDHALEECYNLEKVTINNPNCTIYDSDDTISGTATIYGYSGSTAQAYAEKYNRTFIPLG